MWYGHKSIKWENKIKNLKLRHKLKIKTLNIFFPLKINLNRTNFFFYFPLNWNISILKFKNKNTHYCLCYLYSNTYFFFIPVIHKFSKIKFDAFTNILYFKSLYDNNFFNIYWTFFNILFFSFSKIFFKKLKFRGKGYYIYKNIRNTVAPQFNYSHMVRIFGYNISLKFLTKTIIFVYGINYNDILKMSKKIYIKRPFNIFTGKGVRFSKQIIYKKTGKISSYR